MNELLQSIKADLLSRHMLALLGAAGAALLGALVYVALAGSGGASKPVASAPAAATPGGLPVALAPPNPAASAAETPAGIQYQTQGATRDPFTPLPGTPVATAASAAGASASASASTGKSSSSSSSGGGGGSSSAAGSTNSKSTSSTPAPARAPAPTVPRHTAPTPLKPQLLFSYDVSAMFGSAPANPGEQPALSPYEDMKRFEPLPSAKRALVVFVGVLSKSGHPALFGLAVPPILRGVGSCYPNDTHCEAIELKVGQSEELEYIKPNGETVAYELKVVGIKRHGASSGAQARALRISRVGRRALRHAGLLGAW
jgi:hypothetical protein